MDNTITIILEKTGKGMIVACDMDLNLNIAHVMKALEGTNKSLANRMAQYLNKKNVKKDDPNIDEILQNITGEDLKKLGI